jgi:2-aminoadipate transaminase
MSMALDFTSLFAPGLPPPAVKWNGFAKYNFIGGHNDANQVPLEALIKAANDVLTREGRTLAAYGLASGPLGYRPLREFLARKLERAAGIRCDADEILITSGSLQALDLVNGILLARGDTVIIEQATYQGALTRLQASVSKRSAFRATGKACAWIRLLPRSIISSTAGCGRNTSTRCRPCKIRPGRS